MSSAPSEMYVCLDFLTHRILIYVQVTSPAQNVCAAKDPAANVCRPQANLKKFLFAMVKILP